MTSVDVHLGTYELDAHELPNGHVYLQMREHLEDSDCTLYFEDTAAMRVFMARALSELRRVERGDAPYNTTNDRIEMPVEEVHRG